MGKEVLRETVRRALKYSPKEDTEIVIWDNSPAEYRDIEKYVVEMNHPRVKYLGQQENLGQTGSKNKLVKYIKQRDLNVKNILLLDQDAFLNFGAWDELKRIAEKYPNAGLISFPEIFEGVPVLAQHPRFPTKDLDAFMVGDIPFTAIYLNVEMFDKINGFNEELFFHAYDSEFSQRMQAKTEFRIYVTKKKGHITHEAHYTGKNFNAKRNEMIQKDLAVWTDIMKKERYLFVPDLHV